MIVMFRRHWPRAGEFVSKTYGAKVWAVVLDKLGLSQHWSKTWLPTCPNPDKLMIE